MKAQRDRKKTVCEMVRLKIKTVKSDQRGENVCGKTKKCYLATLSLLFPSNRGKTISYQVITGQEAEPSVAFLPVKAVLFL